MIDEAAAIPLPLVKSLLGPYLVFMASTINGYENTHTHTLYLGLLLLLLLLALVLLLLFLLMTLLLSYSYEGTGRSLSLKLLQQLRHQSVSHLSTVFKFIFPLSFYFCNY